MTRCMTPKIAWLISFVCFKQQMRVNYLGTVYCTKCVVDSMKERRSGRIVFVSSQAGQIGVFGYSAYSPTKFALKGFCEALQMELRPYNIYMTLVYPPDTGVLIHSYSNFICLFKC